MLFKQLDLNNPNPVFTTFYTESKTGIRVVFWIQDCGIIITKYIWTTDILDHKIV